MGDPKSIIHALLQGLELARQLQVYLHLPTSSQETRDLLIQKIISTFEKALEMVNCKGPVPAGESSHHPLGAALIRVSDSPLSSSPRSEDSDRDFKDQDPNAFKKRNTLPRWTKHIRVTPGMGVEGPLDDGYSWRKYGQKDILGALYPRGYYRCTHRNVQGCMATKQVQRSDEDPTIFEITYRGKHTCTMANNVGSSSPIPPENQEPSLNNTNPQQQNILQNLEQQQSDLLLSLRKGLRVQTENLDSPDQQSLVPFRFPLSTNIKIESQVFPSPVLENFISSPSYMSSAASGISHFSVSPSGVNSFGGNPNLANSESQINDMIPATTTSAPNSSTVGLEFPFDQFEFDGQNFTFDNPPFFS